MRRGDRVVLGREAELAAVDEVSGRALLLLVRGQPGMGRTTLLKEVHRTWRTRGPGIVRIHCSATIPRWDLFGARAVLKAFRNAFPDTGPDSGPDTGPDTGYSPPTAGISAAISAANRLYRPESYGSARAQAALFAELVRLFAHLARSTPGAVLIDDVHAAPDPALIVAAAHRAGCTVVATYREDGWGTGPTGPTGPPGSASLSGFADRVVDLGPLPGHRIDALLADAAREPLDEAVAPALRAALGPLAGNPGTVLDTFEALRRDGRLVRFQGHLCLSDPATAPALPVDHPLARRVAQCGGTARQLLALTASAGHLAMDDLPDFAAATGHDLAACGRTVDHLVALGALTCDDHGILHIPCPALVPAVLPGTARTEAAEVHRALAEHLLRGGHTPPPHPTVPAEHITLAGTALPATPTVVPLLEHEAARALPTYPTRAARWYRAALHHCEPGDPSHSRILATLLPLLVRIGDYEGLAEAVQEEERAERGRAEEGRAEEGGAEEGGAEEPGTDEKSAAYAALAAVHTGRPVPVSAGAVPGGGGPEFAGRWFGGRAPLRAGEAVAAFGCLRPAGSSGDGPPGTGTAASDLFDPVALFRRVLGTAGYGEPLTGPLAAHARILRDYRDGNWAGIPSEARALELTGPPHTPVHHTVRLITAEVHSTLGDFERSAAWLESAGADCPFPALRTWAAMGLAYRTGQSEHCRELGWAHCEEAAEEADGTSPVGIDLLLVRLAFTEWGEGGRRELLARLHAEAERWYDRLGGTGLRTASLIIRAFAERDVADAHTAVDILREHGGRSELLRACMTVAFLADDPLPGRQEAHDIARSLGDPLHRTAVTESMRAPGTISARADTERDSTAGLSDLEGRIAVLVGRGLTNRQIARELQVSQKTVENNLTQVFAKTGCRSRLDLALAVMEDRLTGLPPRS